MKIKYQFVTGETVEVEASGALGETIVALDREIYNNNQRETRRHCSFDKLTDAGFQIADAKSEVAAAVEQMDRNVALHEAINALSPKQKRLIQQVFFEEKTITKIAQDEGVHKSAISHRLATIYRELKKSLKNI